MLNNLNNPGELTLKNVATLINSGDDSLNTQFCVTKTGYFYLCDYIKNLNQDELLFHLEQNDTGNNYAGKFATTDELWVTTIFTVIHKNWPCPISDKIEDFSSFSEAVSKNLCKINLR